MNRKVIAFMLLSLIRLAGMASASKVLPPQTDGTRSAWSG